MRPAPTNSYIKFTCRSCGWSIIIRQTSDVIVGPKNCRRCDAGDLLRNRANLLDILPNLWSRR